MRSQGFMTIIPAVILAAFSFPLFASSALDAPAVRLAEGEGGAGSSDPLPGGCSVTPVVGPHGSASVTGTNLVASGQSYACTFTADEGYVIAAVMVDGVPVPESRFQSSYDLSVTPTDDQTALTVSAYFVQDGVWWAHSAPVAGKVIDYPAAANVSPSRTGLSEKGSYFIASLSSGEDATAYLYKTFDLFAGEPAPMVTVQGEQIPGMYSRGADVSETIGTAILAPTIGEGSAFAVDLTSDLSYLREGKNLFRISNDCNVYFNAMSFAGDGARLYTDSEIGDGRRKSIFRWDVRNKLHSSGLHLEAWGRWNVDTRVRQIDSACAPGDTDLVYFTSDGGLVGLLDPEVDRSKVLLEADGSGDMNAVSVTGLGEGTPYLTILPSDASRPIAIYALAEDGRSLVSTNPVASIAPSTMATWNPNGSEWHRADASMGVGLNTSPDGRIAYISASPADLGACTYVVVNPGKQTRISIDVGKHGSASLPNGILDLPAGIAKDLSVTADPGYLIAALYTNGVKVASARFQTSFEHKGSLDGFSLRATFCKKNAWWVAPFVRHKILYGQGVTSPSGALILEDEGLLALANSDMAYSAGAAGLSAFNLDGVRDTLAPFYPPVKFSSEYLQNDGEESPWFAYSPVYRTFLAANTYTPWGVEETKKGQSIAWPLDGQWGDPKHSSDYLDERWFVESDLPAEEGRQTLAPAVFDTKSTYLYGQGSQTYKVYQMKVCASPSGKLTRLARTGVVWKLPYHADAMTLLKLGDSELIYVAVAPENQWAEGYEGKLYLIDPSVVKGPGEYQPILLADHFPWMTQISITGKEDGTLRLLGGCGELYVPMTIYGVWDLAADGRSLLSREPIISWNRSELLGLPADDPTSPGYDESADTKVGGFAAEDDDLHAFFTHEDGRESFLCDMVRHPEMVTIRHEFSYQVDGVPLSADYQVPFGSSTNFVITLPGDLQLQCVSMDGEIYSNWVNAATCTVELKDIQKNVYLRSDIKEDSGNQQDFWVTWVTAGEPGAGNIWHNKRSRHTKGVTVPNEFYANKKMPWRRILSVDVNGVPIPEAAGRPSYNFSYPDIQEELTVTVTFGIPPDGVDGYTREEVRWLIDNDIPDHVLMGDPRSARYEMESDNDGDGIPLSEELLFNLSPTASDKVSLRATTFQVGPTCEVAYRLERTSGGQPVTRPLLGKVALGLEGAESLDKPFLPVPGKYLPDAFGTLDTETIRFELPEMRFFRAVVGRPE